MIRLYIITDSNAPPGLKREWGESLIHLCEEHGRGLVPYSGTDWVSDDKRTCWVCECEAHAREVA